MANDVHAVSTTATNIPLHPMLRSAQVLEHLDAEIHIRRSELEALERAKEVLLGATLISKTLAAPTQISTPSKTATIKTTPPTTIADAVEQILSLNTGPLRADALVVELQRRYKMATTPKNLINTLNRWISRGTRFSRPEPNTFALRAR